MKPNEQFFFDNAGYSYDPETQTPEQGQIACARSLAVAELDAKAAGIYFTWGQDPEIDSSSFSDELPVRPLWCCDARNAKFQVVVSLCGIDLGEQTPFSRPPYCRVVEAELAAEVLS